MTSDVECDVTYKVLMLGDASVGKTSLIRSLTGAKFSHAQLTTVGIDFVKVVFAVDGAKVRLQIWDTAGQERFRSMTRFQYRGTKGLILVYDITNRASFDTLDNWLQNIELDLDQNNKESIPVILVGNKCDLPEQRQVTEEEGKQVADHNMTFGFWETSALNGNNVYDCFAQMARVLTDMHHPHLMDMYKYSDAIERTKHPRDIDTVDGRTPGGVHSKSIKLKSTNYKTRHKLKCSQCDR